MWVLEQQAIDKGISFDQVFRSRPPRNTRSTPPFAAEAFHPLWVSTAKSLQVFSSTFCFSPLLPLLWAVHAAFVVPASRLKLAVESTSSTILPLSHTENPLSVLPMPLFCDVKTVHRQTRTTFSPHSWNNSARSGAWLREAPRREVRQRGMERAAGRRAAAAVAATAATKCRGRAAGARASCTAPRVGDSTRLWWLRRAWLEPSPRGEKELCPSLAAQVFFRVDGASFLESAGATMLVE